MKTPVEQLDPAAIERKLRLASDLFDFAMKVKRFRISEESPELSEEEVTRRAYELIERGCR